MSTSKEDFLNHIRTTLGRTQPITTPPTPPAVDDPTVRLTDADQDLTALFVENATSTGMQVTRCTAETLVQSLQQLIGTQNIKSITFNCPSLGELQNEIKASLQNIGVVCEPWENDREMKKHYEVDAGICDVHAALAETGTLVCESGPQHARGHSLVVEIHIAIVKASDILPDMIDLMPRYNEQTPDQLPSAIALITGPSKTADIEGILITGVHGPGQVFTLVVDNL